MPRMKVLSTVEQEAFDTPPLFNSVQRKQYFDASLHVQQIANSLRTPINQVCFLLSGGYFKATKRFFLAPTFHPRDMDYVATRAGLALVDLDLSGYDKQTVARHQQLILKIYGFRPFNKHARAFISAEMATLVRSQIKPRLIFWRCVDLLVVEHIQVPNYFPLAELILAAINQRKKALASVIESVLIAESRALLDELFVQSDSLDGEPVASKTAAYKLTLLKKLSQSTKPSKVKARAADLALVEELYTSLLPVLNALELNHEGIRYYANSVIKSEIFQMARRADEDRYLHVIAFIAHQYYRLQDNLVDSLLASLQSYQNTAQREHKEQCYARREQRSQSIKGLLAYLDEQLLGTLAAIRALAEDETLSDAEKLARIRTLLETRDSQQAQAEIELTRLKSELNAEISEADYYQILEARSVRIQNRISPILKVLKFQGGFCCINF